MIVAENIQLANTSEEIRLCYKIMCQLRTHLQDEETFVAQVKRQLQQGYCLAYLQLDGIAALAGFRFLEFLAWGKVLYIDDLITDTEARRNGYGGQLLQWLIGQAKEAGCHQVHLDSGPQRYDAHRLYLNHGFKIIGHHFSFKLTT